MDTSVLANRKTLVLLFLPVQETTEMTTQPPVKVCVKRSPFIWLKYIPST